MNDICFEALEIFQKSKDIIGIEISYRYLGLIMIHKEKIQRYFNLLFFDKSRENSTPPLAAKRFFGVSCGFFFGVWGQKKKNTQNKCLGGGSLVNLLFLAGLDGRVG